MATLMISPQANQDLLDIWLYIAEDNLLNADRFLDKIKDTAQRLAEFNDIGTDRPELADGLLSFPLDRYMLYYRKIDAGIELARVLHGSRDVLQIF